MCDTYTPSGYICWECKDEFKEYLRAENSHPENEGEINRELQRFMDTTKDNFVKGEDISIDDYFTKHSR